MKSISYCSVIAEIARCPWVRSWKRNLTGDCMIVRCTDMQEAVSLAVLFEGHSKGKKAYIPIIKGIGYQEELEEAHVGQQARLL